MVREFLLYNNKDKYEGDWKNNFRHGKGKIVYANGDIYDGEWANDKKGYGKLSIIINGIEYLGYFKDDSYHGEGTYKTR